MNVMRTPESARLRLLAQIMWAMVACCAICIVIALAIAGNQPSASVCESINQVNQQLGTPPANCGAPAGEVAAGIAAGIFAGLTVITVIIRAFVAAGIRDRDSSGR